MTGATATPISIAADRDVDIDLPTEGDLAVRLVDFEKDVSGNCLLQKITDTAFVPIAPSTIPDISSSSEEIVLDSPFQSPKSPLTAEMSDTTLEDGEILDHVQHNLKEKKTVAGELEVTAKTKVDDSEQLSTFRP
jgi:hypothetical protein